MIQQPDALTFIEGILDAAILIDRDGHVVAANEPFMADWAASDAIRSQIIGRRIEDLVEILDDTLIRQLSQISPVGLHELIGISLWRAGEKQKRRADLRVSTIGSDSEWMLVTLLPPSTEAQREIAKLESSRREILGTCAAGFAHDINNQLAACLNVTSIMRDELGSEQEYALGILESATQEAVLLARRLLIFAGRGEPTISETPIDQIVEDAIKLIRHEIPSPDRFAIEIRGISHPIHGDAVRLQQLVALLVLAGAKAVSESGTGEFRAINHAIGHGRYPAGGGVELSLRTSQPLRAEDPIEFARSIIEAHGGLLETEGDPVDAVLIHLPIATLRPSAQTVDSVAHGGPSRRHHVLVVDDDPTVRNVAVQMVERLGYVAIPASGGLEAVEFLRDSANKVDLIILDIMMNDLDGITALRQIRSVRPNIRVVLSSGYGDPGVQAGSEVQFDGTLEKPYTMSTLKELLGKYT